MTQSTLQKYDCDRCGFTYKKDQLRRQRGMLVCGDCWDNLKKIPQPKPRWRSPREDSDTTTPVNNPTVYTISAATGVTTLGQSVELTREGGRRNFYMRVVSNGGAISISASPQIVAGTQGDVLTLHGTSNTDTIKLNDTSTVKLAGDSPMTLTDGDSITLVYDTSLVCWTECSRNKGGI
jgi:hypothetical protein